MFPEVTLSMPDITISKDVLPEPDGPTIATELPSQIDKLILCKIFTLPEGPFNVKFTSINSIDFCKLSFKVFLIMKKSLYKKKSYFYYSVLLLFGLLIPNNITATNIAVNKNASDTSTGGYNKSKILVLGDSLTAGYGLEDINDSFPSKLEKILISLNYKVEIINAGISGDTTTGGLSRLAWSLNDNPDAVILELGGNDGLRAISPKLTYQNLEKILKELEGRKIPTLLTGMMAPPNLGNDYTELFYSNYKRLASSYDVIFYPFFLEGVAGEESLNQPDLIHPNPDGVEVIVDNILPFVEELIQQIGENSEK